MLNPAVLRDHQQLAAVFNDSKEKQVQGLTSHQWRTERGWGGVQTPLKFRRYDKVEPDCKFSGTCLVFLFQQPN